MTRRRIHALLGTALLLPCGHLRSQDESWAARYGGRVPGLDRPRAITVDDDSNVYVTGFTTLGGTGGIGGPNECVTFKYDSRGRTVWSATYRGTTSAAGGDLSVDVEGNVYVAGTSDAGDIFLIKYGPTGNELWFRRFSGPDESIDSFADLAMDLNGAIYLTGSSYGLDFADDPSEDRDYITLKYNSAGTLLWQARFDAALESQDRAVSLGVDSQGSIYVTGTSVVDQVAGFLTVKYDSGGQEIWASRYEGPAGNPGASAKKLAINDDASLDGIRRRGRRVASYVGAPPVGGGVGSPPAVYVTGSSSLGPETKSDWVTVKYDAQTGEQLWERFVDGGIKSYDRVRDIAVGPGGNVHVAGSIGACWLGRCFNGQRTEDYGLVKYAPDGRELWFLMYDRRSYSNDASAMVVDHAGNIYLTGTSARLNSQAGSPPSDTDFVTVLFDADGTFSWAARYDGPPSGREFARHLAIDHLGNVYVTGSSESLLPERHPSWEMLDYATVKFEGDSLTDRFRPFRRGDSDADGEISVADAVANLSYQFLGRPVPCLDACDFDDSGTLEITDPIANLSFQFLGGRPPKKPGRHTCGFDPTRDDLLCESYAACDESE